jgi:hypothetical protein
LPKPLARRKPVKTALSGLRIIDRTGLKIRSEDNNNNAKDGRGESGLDCRIGDTILADHFWLIIGLRIDAIPNGPPKRHPRMDGRIDVGIRPQGSDQSFLVCKIFQLRS